jgi:hypothetical protein
LESGGIRIVGGGGLCCDSRERGESSFIGSGVVERAVRGVETKSQGIESEIEPSLHSRSTEKMPWKRVVVPHRILTFWPHWLTMRGAHIYPPKVMV